METKEEIHDGIIELLNKVDKTNFTKKEFEIMAESIIDYIDEIARSLK